ncbi:ABC transporter substrate-binding protein [Umezawaea sp.]|uniref:ABC transporter substrate-binding protein n=1 Tax=Umezawaea sp. TaxID=1955258 RepID=UPI002ED356EA
MVGRALRGAAVASVFLLSACGGGPPSAAPPAPAGAGFPVELENCRGARISFDSAPSRIVTSNASSLEVLFWLGAQEKVLGTGFPPAAGTMPEEFAEAAAKVPVLGDRVIAKEKLLGSGADLYIDTFSGMGAMGGAAGVAPTEEEFAAVGVKHLFLRSTACPADAGRAVTDLSGVQEDIRRLGAVTGTAARAGELVAGMERTTGEVRAALAGVPEGERPTYYFFDVGATPGQPVAACNQQVANAVITLAGARNVYGDCSGGFKPVGWEDVVARNPDWIQLGVRNRGDARANQAGFDEAVRFLKEFPATAGLEAVREDRFLRIPSERTTIASVRNADTVREIAATLHPDLVKAG